MGLSKDYEVRVAGTIGPAAREAFADLEITVEPGSTVLAGELDQAGLHGVIERIASLGLELVDIRRRTADGEFPWP
ncbi:hypothetical protein [Terrabacter sp. Root85]|uniref:hypothetical protein n=1 Tax=Terrabacter sp. Root85 TaxID=1736603 RepID=UPI000A950F33|nr:hypothetical protein [Terrabacter sp. Root85]